MVGHASNFERYSVWLDWEASVSVSNQPVRITDIWNILQPLNSLKEQNHMNRCTIISECNSLEQERKERKTQNLPKIMLLKLAKAWPARTRLPAEVRWPASGWCWQVVRDWTTTVRNYVAWESRMGNLTSSHQSSKWKKNHTEMYILKWLRMRNSLTYPLHCQKHPPQGPADQAMTEEEKEGKSHPLCAHNLACQTGHFLMDQSWCTGSCREIGEWSILEHKYNFILPSVVFT